MRKKFHGLKRIKLRQSWNKYNLYNLSRAKNLATENMTYFQQKWQSKSSTRAYHGEQIREKHWKGMFRPRMASVVPMDHAYLARYDGSEQAAGRGSGLETKDKIRPIQRTPYMNMVYAPMERRLDTAIFRALFASSTRQARQFVVHGFVKVNGKKMIYPGYLLNPGDMFQVAPERVLFATGARKDSPDTDLEDPQPESIESLEQAAEATKAEAEADEAPIEPDATENPAESQSPTPKERLSDLLTRARSILSDPKDSLPGKRKRDIRAFQRSARAALSRSSSPNADSEQAATTLDAQLSQLLSSLSVSPESSQSTDTSSSTPDVSEADSAALKRALVVASENPIDDTKPYATPWRPREYMSAFAFIPRFLEVNQNICAAVYLRHPVARPGLAEVPSPFGGDTHALAFNWYLRRR
ncbi:MAG: mitochondrial 37S ribosomal protein nam9 [Sclerophora amabilis]|nr:MAG: mitochondrial 37S ribosomal protein nam9 [Sclerophora amabilis]